MVTWQTITVALVSSFIGGAGGALLTVLLRIRHERDEQLRDRMLAAADELTTGLVQARMVTGDAVVRSEVPADDGPTFDEVLKKAEELVDHAKARQGRVDLLFDDRSPSGLAAAAALDDLYGAVNHLVERPLSSHGVGLARSRLKKADTAIRDFNRAAREAVRKPQRVGRQTEPPRGDPPHARTTEASSARSGRG
jgi:hypothetical protein